MKTTLGCLLLFALFLYGGLADAKVLHVAKDATGNGSGSDWSNATSTVAQALNVAEPSDEIWVKAAVYNETIYVSGNLSLYGGFKGDETQRAERNWKANETILDATGLKSSVVTFAADAADITLDGFTITNGSGDRGGGILCERSLATVANCRIIKNHASETGGGIFLWLTPVMVLQNCLIADNDSAAVGGGMFIWDHSFALIQDCTFERNVTPEQGGGIFMWEYCSPVLERCLFIGNNVGGIGGGINCGTSSSPTLINCVFMGNFSGADGGAFYFFESSPELMHCTIVGNSSGGTGGAAYSSQVSYPIMTNSIVWQNEPNGIVGEATDLIGVTWCDLQDPLAGEGNISKTPDFLQPWDGASADLRLGVDSPCIDAGKRIQEVTDDLDGRLRPVDVPSVGFDGLGQGYDLGAYEYQPEFPWWDANRDGVVDARDLLLFIENPGSDSKNRLFFEFASHWNLTIEQP